MVASLRALQFFASVVIAATVVAVEEDHHSNCPNWAEVGECDLNSDYMDTNCASSCHHHRCSGWAEGGECEANPAYMLEHCSEECEAEEKAQRELEEELADISSFFDLEAEDIHGETIHFDQFRGKVTIVVNVASYCGYTESHYRGLVDLWSKVKNEPVEIIAFPCNQFGAQEPEEETMIERFAHSKGVEFRMMSKIDVNGPDASVVYKFLKYETEHSHITWNFATYFVVSPEGDVTAHTGVEPGALYGLTMELLGNSEL